MKILLTGGAGYIGSHLAVELMAAGHEAVIVDNLVNSCQEVVKRIERLAARPVEFHQVDLLDAAGLESIVGEGRFDAVVHLAALKSVAGSVADPLNYHHVNIGGAVNLCRAMGKAGVKNLIFSSSSLVYRQPAPMPLTEEMELGGSPNPYGDTKLAVEKLLMSLQRAEPDWNIVSLRYFNPIGAHESGEIGEHPAGVPDNLMPYICQCAVGWRDRLTVFGDDYQTPDGTCVRDYIHVVDLAKGHLAALEKLKDGTGLEAYNLGSGKGHSVMELIKAFERANQLEVPHRIGPRRPGDLPAYYSDPAKANRELGWRTERSLEDACRDAWRWQRQNPRGYE